MDNHIIIYIYSDSARWYFMVYKPTFHHWGPHPNLQETAATPVVGGHRQAGLMSEPMGISSGDIPSGYD